MTPLLTIYADIVGILGGLLVGTSVMGFSALHYLEQTQAALTNMWEVYSGVSKVFFGLIIGLVGCYKEFIQVETRFHLVRQSLPLLWSL